MSTSRIARHIAWRAGALLGCTLAMISGVVAIADSDATSIRTIEVSGAVSHPSAGVPVGVVYLNIKNNGDRVERLIAVRTPAADRAELHETVTHGDIVRMKHHPDGFEIPPGAGIALAPGGKHIMLLGLLKPLVAGETLMLDLEFERAKALTLEVPIESR